MFREFGHRFFSLRVNWLFRPLLHILNCWSVSRLSRERPV